MANPIVVVGAQGYCDPNRLDQGHSFSQTVILPTIPSTIHGRIPKVDDTTKLVLDNSIYDSIKIKDIPMLQLNEGGHVTGLGLGEKIQQASYSGSFTKDGERKVVHVSLEDGDPEPERTVEAIQRMLITPKEDGVYARGETPVIAHIDELPYYKTEAAVGETGTPGIKGDDDSGIALDHVGSVKGNRAQRRKAKAAGKKGGGKHLPNMKSKVIKAALGASILNNLGKIQRDTTDAVKREVLRDLPLSGFVEAVTGKTLPEYQKRLLDLQQARAEGTLKPELESLGTQAPRLEAEATVQ